MDLRRIDLNLLPVLEALHEEGTVTGAARRLKVSQPTLSVSLARLRESFSDPLFVRGARGMKPTPFAISLRQPVREMLSIIQRDILPKQAFNPDETTRVFTLTTSDVGELCFLPGLIKAFKERAPNATLQCVSVPPAELERALIAGDIDIAAGYFPDLRSPELRHQALFEHPFVCIARRGHPDVRPGMTIDHFLAARHAVVRQKGRSQEIADRTIDEMGLVRTIGLQSPHFTSLPFLIADSDLISIVPRALGNAFAGFAGLQMMPLPVALPPIPLAQHWAAASEADPATLWLVRLIGELFLGRDPTLRAETDDAE